MKISSTDIKTGSNIASLLSLDSRQLFNLTDYVVPFFDQVSIIETTEIKTLEEGKKVATISYENILDLLRLLWFGNEEFEDMRSFDSEIFQFIAQE